MCYPGMRSRSRRNVLLGAGAGAAGAGTFCPEPPNSFTLSRCRNWSRNASPEPEPEPTKNVTAPHPWCYRMTLLDCSTVRCVFTPPRRSVTLFPRHPLNPAVSYPHCTPRRLTPLFRTPLRLTPLHTTTAVSSVERALPVLHHR